MTRSQQYSNGNRGGAAGWPPVPSIPLSQDTTARPEEQSLGELIRDATTHMSTLIRSEVELAKMEVAAEVRKGVRGSVYFILALGVGLFSSFFFFFALAELLADLGLWRSAAFGIVFLLMLVTTLAFAYLGFRRVRGIRAPKRTISTMRDTAAKLTHRGDYADDTVH